ncbi:hypothetical protein FH968_23440 [Buttiauxella sp. B2]|uniref:hypothetical protein n=1 Tax=Buttiauxella sp. B2 TaxID=2587812 RepID=UPI0011208858|nr:hypothetical protein [Buttiauxella sp. B2]TNV09206.1 hypothetical protein FH968_23440 [Buttiauxella sp. B2]
MDIEISSPINITMDVIELDEHVPSLKFSITIRVKKFSYSSEINSQLWIECQCFDDFIDNMRKGDTAVLKDMNDFFELRVNPMQNWLEWSCAREDMEGNITSANGKEKLTDQSKHSLYEVFNDYPKWW